MVGDDVDGRLDDGVVEREAAAGGVDFRLGASDGRLLGGELARYLQPLSAIAHVPRDATRAVADGDNRVERLGGVHKSVVLPGVLFFASEAAIFDAVSDDGIVQHKSTLSTVGIDIGDHRGRFAPPAPLTIPFHFTFTV